MLRDVPRRFLARLAVISGVALVARIVYVVANQGHRMFDPSRIEGGDALFFHQQADLLVHGHWFVQPFPGNSGGLGSPSADHPPVFTLLLAAADKLGITSYSSHQVMCAVIGAIGVLLVGLLAREVAGDRAGLLGAIVFAAYVNVWIFEGIAVSEAVAVPMTALALLCVYRFARVPDWRRAAWLGLACALGALTRAESVLLLPLIVLPLVLLLDRVQLYGESQPRPAIDMRRKASLLVVVGVTSGLVMAPWVVRNLVTFEEPVYLSTGAGLTMASGTCDLTFDGEFLGYWSIGCVGYVDQPEGDASVVDVFFRERALRYLQDHKGEVPKVVLARLGRVWGLYRPIQQAEFDRFSDNKEYWLSRLGLAQFYLLAGLGIVGAISLRRRRLLLFAMIAPFLVVSFSVVITFGNTRYRAIAEPVLAVLAAVGLDAVMSWSSARRVSAADSEQSPADPVSSV